MKVAGNGLDPIGMRAVHPSSSDHHGGVIICAVRLGTVQGPMVPALARGVAGIDISVGAAVRPGCEGPGR
jgi:hypothetical protein